MAILQKMLVRLIASVCVSWIVAEIVVVLFKMTAVLVMVAFVG